MHLHSKHLFSLFIALSFASLIWYLLFVPRNSYRDQYAQANQIKPTPVPCQADGLICPDGTVLSRVGPSCVFPSCPPPGLNKKETPTSTAPQIEMGALFVLTPQPNNYMVFPMFVKGSVKDSSHQVSLKLTDAAGKMLVNKTVKPVLQGDRGVFTATLSAKTKAKTGSLTVTELGTKLPAEANILTIPLVFAQ
jgi:hypothetical protein